MGVLESPCPRCGKPIRVYFHDRSLETLMVERLCECPSAVTVRPILD